MDKVKVTITHTKQGNRRCEGKIIGVLEHQLTELVGTFQKTEHTDLLYRIMENSG